MTLDEAITRFEQLGEISLDKSECECVEVSLLNEWKEEQKQVAAWLKELVEYRSKEDTFSGINPTVIAQVNYIVNYINCLSDESLICEYYRVRNLLSENDSFNPMSYAECRELRTYLILLEDAAQYRQITLS